MFRCMGCLQGTDLPLSLAFWELPRISTLRSLIIEAECLEECMQDFGLECKGVSLDTPLFLCVFSSLSSDIRLPLTEQLEGAWL